METINSFTPSCTCKDPATQFSAQANRTQLTAMTSSRSIDLDLVTEDGDKVTLSIDAKASALYMSSGEVQVDEDGLLAQWSELGVGQFERETVLTVEGDLNRKERREIRKVIKTIDKMMKNFVDGKLDPMMAKAQKLGRLETIDSLQLSMAYERQVVVAQQSQASATYNQFGQSPSVPALEKESPSLQLASEARSLARDMAREVAAAPDCREPILEMTEQLFTAHRRRARRAGPMGGRIMDHIRDLFKAAVDDDTMPWLSETVRAVAGDDMVQ
jgi:hypothetical protein